MHRGNQNLKLYSFDQYKGIKIIIMHYGNWICSLRYYFCDYLINNFVIINLDKLILFSKKYFDEYFNEN